MIDSEQRVPKQEGPKVILKIIGVAVFLYLFLVSIQLMGSSLKGFGKDFAQNLLATTSNPFVGLFIGILATSIIQSSSTTSSIVVGMVAGGVITIGNAIPIVMGANIGTTVTNTLVSLGHITRRDEFKRAITGSTIHDFFNLICVSILFPLELATGFLQKSAGFLSKSFLNFGGAKFTSPIKFIVSPTVDAIEYLFLKTIGLADKIGHIIVFIFSLILLFSALYFIVKIMKSLILKRTETVLGNIIEKRGIIAIFAGFLFTAIVQSSSITTSLLIPLVGAGIITIELAYPIIMGANVGTTVTAILASFATGNAAAITIAFAHLLFNLIGVTCIYPIKIIRQIPIKLAKGLGELAFRRRRYAIFYVLGVFFVIPGILILISKLIK